MQTYLITGGLGYLGSQILSELSSKDCKIIIYDKSQYGLMHMPAIFSLMKNPSNLEIVIGDVRDEKKLNKYIKKADIVIHLAALVGAPLVKRKAKEAQDTNIDGTRVLTSLISKNQRFLFASTGSTYGHVDGVCTEKTEISPLSEYGVHKKIGEEITSEKDATQMRFATVYGISPRTRNDLFINNMVRKALIDQSVVLYQGYAKRTFAHVKDIARSVIFLSNLDNPHVGPINIGDERLSFTKLEICKSISSLINFNIIEDDFSKDIDQRDYAVDYSLFNSYGFEFKDNYERSLVQLISYYKMLIEASYENG